MLVLHYIRLIRHRLGVIRCQYLDAIDTFQMIIASILRTRLWGHKTLRLRIFPSLHCTVAEPVGTVTWAYL